MKSKFVAVHGIPRYEKEIRYEIESPSAPITLLPVRSPR